MNSLPQTGFGFGVSYNAGNPPFVVGDFNGDGKPDIAAVGFNGVNVLLNRGGGIFNPAVNYPAGYGPSNIAVGDFNGDGLQRFGCRQFRERHGEYSSRQRRRDVSIGDHL